jgi:hypothetical protein
MSSNIERDATLLGFGGVLPFAFGAIVAWFSPSVFPGAFATYMLLWVLIYGAVILSFMGGARWALAMLSDGATGTPMSGLLTAVTPALLGWLAAVPAQLLPVPMPYWLRFSLLAAGFIGLWAEDRIGVARGEAPAWYGRLRTRLTFWVLIAVAFIVARVSL